MKKIRPLVEELKKTNGWERKLSILKKILEIATSLASLFRISVGMISH